MQCLISLNMLKYLVTKYIYMFNHLRHFVNTFWYLVYIKLNSMFRYKICDVQPFEDIPSMEWSRLRYISMTEFSN